METTSQCDNGNGMVVNGNNIAMWHVLSPKAWRNTMSKQTDTEKNYLCIQIQPILEIHISFMDLCPIDTIIAYTTLLIIWL